MVMVAGLEVRSECYGMLYSGLWPSKAARIEGAFRSERRGAGECRYAGGYVPVYRI